MKICILTPRFPFPENGGDVLRINEIARYLKKRNHELILVSFYEKNNPDIESAHSCYDRVYLMRRNRFVSLVYSILFLIRRKPIQCGYYYSPSYNRLFKKVVAKEKPDLFISHLLRMSEYLMSNHLEGKSIMEMTDALSKTYTLAAGAKSNWLKKSIYNIEKSPILREENKAITLYPKVVLVSPSDIDYFNNSNPHHRSSLFLHTNGVECLDAPENTYVSSKICFVGNMRTLQNQDAVIRFVKDIFPLIKERISDAQFYVVGAEPPQKILDLADGNSVVVTGFVEDLYSVIKDSCVAVAPVTVAAGIQNKVLVSMGCGLPVVMSSLISNAIPQLVDHDNCMICDENKSFADCCVDLMTNKDLRNRIALAGYDMVRTNYSWDKKLEGYEVLHDSK